METNKLQWKRIAKGEKLPCTAMLMKEDGTIITVATCAGVVVGQDAYYLPVEELRTLPKDDSEDERIRKGIIRNLEYLMDRAEGFVKDELKERIAWLEKLKDVFAGFCDWNDYKDKPVDVWNAYARGFNVGQEIGKNAVKNCPEDYGLEKQAEHKSDNHVQWSDEEELHIRELESLVKQVWATAEHKNDKDTIHKMSDLSFFLKTLNPEKKGEQKPADKVEPKFNEGDWVVSPNGVYWHIDKISNNRYEVTSNTGESSNWPLDTNIYHKFTIQDAKDGDVLVDKSDGAIGIFQSIGHHPDGGSYNDPSYCFLHCRYDDGFFFADFENGNTMDSDDAIPATKEQRDLLFQEMKEAGYEWDAENKELKKIEQKNGKTTMIEVLQR